MYFLSSYDLLQHPTEELDLGSDDENDESQLILSGGKKARQHTKPGKIVPTDSDASSDSSDSERDLDSPVTMANMEARSRALDAKAMLDADLDAEEMRFAAREDQEGEDDDMDIDGEIDDDGEVFQLPTAEERDAEQKVGAPDVHVVQRRMRECVRVLGNFRKLAAKERLVFFQTDPAEALTQRYLQVTLGIY
jgi:ribosomal RNA methyltransferase Nop2